MKEDLKNTLVTFYEAFQQLDAEKMVGLYHPDVEFEDPAFGKLQGERAMNMWRMLCQSQKGKDFLVNFQVVEADLDKAQVNWEAFYHFSRSGRKVHNKVRATLVFKDGLIVKHLDHFNLYSWSKQALGLKGFLLGHTSFFKKKLHQQTNRLLDDFERRQAGEDADE